MEKKQIEITKSIIETAERIVENFANILNGTLDYKGVLFEKTSFNAIPDKNKFNTRILKLKTIDDSILIKKIQDDLYIAAVDKDIIFVGNCDSFTFSNKMEKFSKRIADDFGIEQNKAKVILKGLIPSIISSDDNITYSSLFPGLANRSIVGYRFRYKKALKSIFVNWKTPAIDLSDFDFTNLDNLDLLFYDSQFEVIDFGTANLSTIKSMRYTFYKCVRLGEIYTEFITTYGKAPKECDMTNCFNSIQDSSMLCYTSSKICYDLTAFKDTEITNYTNIFNLEFFKGILGRDKDLTECIITSNPELCEFLDLAQKIITK